MKKLYPALCLVLLFALLLAPASYAEGSNTDTLLHWDIKIAVPDGATAALKGSSYYIYADEAGYLPYVMLTSYTRDSARDFVDEFTDYMRTQYDDLRVTSEPRSIRIGGKACWEVDYAYSISGYEAKDRRIAAENNGRVYLFCSKEIEELGMTVGTMLEDVIENSVFLTDGKEPEQPQSSSQFADAYLYCLDSGMPKYWLDLSGRMSDSPVLHCWFRSGDPTFYETWYILDLDTADYHNGVVDIHKVTDAYGFDHSDWFKTLRFRLDGDELVLEVERDERTLAGGAEDNVLTGRYRMKEAGVGCLYQYRENGLRLKYWLDTDGRNLLLHALFRGEGPDFYESVFTLDLASAESTDDRTLVFRKVYDSMGLDVSKRFKALRLVVSDGSLTLEVERDESTMAGGAENNILTGSYEFTPKTVLAPPEPGPYSEAQLGTLAQIYYFTNYGFYPPRAEVAANGDGTYNVHLFEVVSLGGLTHTATSAWYTVDAYGAGFNDITGEEVSLVPMTLNIS